MKTPDNDALTLSDSPPATLPSFDPPGRFMSWIHSKIDTSGKQTNVWESRAYVGRELLLLSASLAASLSLSDLRSWIPALVGAVAALHQGEGKRAKASIIRVHAEFGNEAPKLPPFKQFLVDGYNNREKFYLWFWPLFSSFLAAGYARSVSATLVIALLAGYVRAAWENNWFPAWRRSRLGWKVVRKNTIQTKKV